MSNGADPSLVYSLFTGNYKVKLARIAMRLDLFTPLAAGPADAATVARVCNADATGVRALLDYFCGLGVLTRQGNQFALTPTAVTFLVRGARAFTGDLILSKTDPAAEEQSLNAFRTGTPTQNFGNFVQDAWLESYSASRLETAPAMWRAVEIDPRQRDGLRVLDLACGCAIKSFILARENPTIRVMCVDREPVLAVARDLAERWNILSQVSFTPRDILVENFDAASFDVVLLGQISYYLSPEQNTDLFRRIHATLAPRGTFVIDAKMASDPLSESAAMISALLWSTSGGKTHTFAEYRAWLEQADFQNVTQLSEKWLRAKR